MPAGTVFGTIYLGFKPGSLAETSVLLETGTGAVDQTFRISIRMVAGVFTFSIYDGTAVVCLPNTKIKTISDTNWHFAACAWVTSDGTPANQTILKIDDSTSGVTSPASADLGGNAVGGDVPNVGARNNAASAFFTGKMRYIEAFNVLHDASTQSAYYAYWNYLQSLLP